MAGENFIDGSGDTPISWWMFEDAASPSLDGSANNNDLTWNGGVQSPIQYQGNFSLRTDTVVGADRALASLSANFPIVNGVLTQGFTVGGAVYFPSYPNVNPSGHFFQRLDGTITGGWGFMCTGGSASLPAMIFAVDTAGPRLTANDTFTLNRWHQVILRYNGDNRAGAGADNEASLWVNGVKQTQTTIQAIWTPAGGPLVFDIMPGTPLAPTRFDEWFAFDLALLDTQIADLWRYGLSGEDNHSPFVATPNYSLFPKPPIAEAVLRGEM